MVAHAASEASETCCYMRGEGGGHDTAMAEVAVSGSLLIVAGYGWRGCVVVVVLCGVIRTTREKRIVYAGIWGYVEVP